jgi:hypothetical protein
MTQLSKSSRRHRLPKKRQKSFAGGSSAPERERSSSVRDANRSGVAAPRSHHAHTKAARGPGFGGQLRQFGEAVSELERVLATFNVIRHVRPKYACSGLLQRGLSNALGWAASFDRCAGLKVCRSSASLFDSRRAARTGMESHPFPSLTPVCDQA